MSKIEYTVNILIYKMDKLCRNMQFNSEEDRWIYIRRINKLEDELKTFEEKSDKYEKMRLKLYKAANFYRKIIINTRKIWEIGIGEPGYISNIHKVLGTRGPDRVHGKPIMNPKYRRFKN